MKCNQTHSTGCWTNPKHWACAVKHIYRFRETCMLMIMSVENNYPTRTVKDLAREMKELLEATELD